MPSEMRSPRPGRAALGWVLLAGTMYVSTQQLDLAVSFQSVTWLRVLQ
jgi:hypothetical protein